MKSPQPPDNLPIEPLDQRRPWEVGSPRGPLVIEWGDFKLSETDIAGFRRALDADVGEKAAATDAEIQQMAHDTIHALAVLRQLAHRYPGVCRDSIG